MTDAVLGAARDVVRANKNLRDVQTMYRFDVLTADRARYLEEELDAAYEARDTALELLERAMEGQA